MAFGWNQSVTGVNKNEKKYFPSLWKPTHKLKRRNFKLILFHFLTNQLLMTLFLLFFSTRPFFPFFFSPVIFISWLLFRKYNFFFFLSCRCCCHHMMILWTELLKIHHHLMCQHKWERAVYLGRIALLFRHWSNSLIISLPGYNLYGLYVAVLLTYWNLNCMIKIL